MTRDEAYALLTEYNKEPFHLEHAETVEKTMMYYADKLGYVHTCSARIGKFDKSVKFRLIGIVNGVENALLFPFFLPLAFNMLKIVFHLFHPFAV